VGLYLQKCVVLCFLLFLPMAFLWWDADVVLNLVVPDQPETTLLARNFLRVLLFGIPGFILFECGKRYVQAQGIFHASTLVLLACSPVNMLLNYVLVWDKRVGMGFEGAAVAIVITYWLMPLLLLVYIYMSVGAKCWNGFTRDALRGWDSLIRLGVPGIIMVEAEFMAFEVLTIAASRFGTAALAAQSALATLTSLTYQVPFAISIAAATRVANYIGAALPHSASIAARTALLAAATVSVCLGIILFVFRRSVGSLFSNDPDVIDLVARVLPCCAFMQLFDATGGVAGGILRGQGRQRIGGYLNLFFYYPVGLPLSMLLAFQFDWELTGLWAGVTFGLACICSCEIYFILTSNWDDIVDASRKLVRDERIVA
jgi:MATE family multidrug resistance protein